MQWVSLDGHPKYFHGLIVLTNISIGKVGMSVLVKGLAMDFVREGRTDMAVTSI